MIKIAIYGKGGIGKSTISCNTSAALAKRGLTVMQIGCDPKADSTALLHGGNRIPTVLELSRERGAQNLTLDDVVHITDSGVICVEAGGPIPGLGCAGRGIIYALEILEKLGAYEKFKPDAVIYDVLGDVVCGGFSMPMRKDYADRVFVVTSGEKMARYAAANICMAIDNFKNRGYAKLGGIILNCRGTADEETSAAELAADFHTEVIGKIDRSTQIQEADEKGLPMTIYAPDSQAAAQLDNTAWKMYALCGGEKC